MQRPAILPCRDFLVSLLRLLQRQIARQCDDAPQLRIELLDSRQINVRQPLARELA
jgi:hypothetical protein